MPCIDNGAGWDGCERHTHAAAGLPRGRLVVSEAMRDRLTTDLLLAAFHPEAFRPLPAPSALGAGRPAALNPPTPDPLTEHLTRKEHTNAGLYL